MTMRGLLTKLRGEATLMRQAEYSAELVEAVTRESNQTIDPGSRATEAEIIETLYAVLVTPRVRRRYPHHACTDPSPYVHLPALASRMREDQQLPEDVIRTTLFAANDGTLPDAIVERILEDTKRVPPPDTKVIPLRP
jgi:hypothetical protein